MLERHDAKQCTGRRDQDVEGRNLEKGASEAKSGEECSSGRGLKRGLDDKEEGSRNTSHKEPKIDLDRLQDTVGAVAIDMKGKIAAGVSSGGIAMKHQGRVGEAACFGCGCWASDVNGLSVGSSCTGTGEEIMRCLLASTIANGIAVRREQPAAVPCSEVLKCHFGGSSVGGVLAIRVDQATGEGEVICAHTSPSMAFGFQCSAQERAVASVCRMPEDRSRPPGETRCNVESRVFTLA